MKIQDLLPTGFGSKSDVVKAQYIDALISKLTTVARALRNKTAAITPEEAAAQQTRIINIVGEDITIVERP
jgi:hypothetical protein